MCCEQRSAIVAELLGGDNLNITITFNRSFGPRKVEEWNELRLLMENQSLSVSGDRVWWVFEKDGKFSTKSLYNSICNPSCRDGEIMEMWKAGCPLKQKKFLWFVSGGRFSRPLRLRGWTGVEFCVTCGEREDVDHILCSCPVAKFVWTMICPVLGASRLPRNRDEFVNIFVSKGRGSGNLITWFWGVAIMWVLWLVRNERVFQHKVLFIPATLIYRVVSLMLQ
jgi:hypothetical protein